MPGGGQHLGEAGLGSPEVILLTQVTRVAVNIEDTKPAEELTFVVFTDEEVFESFELYLTRFTVYLRDCF